MGTAVMEPETARAMAFEWASIVLTTARVSLESAYQACGAPCFIAKVQELQLPAPLVDFMFGFPDGTVGEVARQLGYVIRGM